MKKSILLKVVLKKVIFISFLYLSNLNSYAYFTNLQNQGTPLASYYLGDKLPYVFYFDINSNTLGWPNPQYGIGKSTDGTGWNWYNATYNTNNGTNWTWNSNGNEAQFTSTGNWYYSGKYTNSSSYTEYACKSWTSGVTTLSGNVSSYFTVNALVDPTSPTATQSSISQINLSWTKWENRNVMVVRRLTSAGASMAPNQGTAYSVGNTLGTGTVVYNGGGTSFNDIGLTPGTSYTYTFYSENYSYYSAGTTASASTVTQTSATTDNFRSKSTGNWSVAGTWESSPDNINWITSTLVPGSNSAAIVILNSHNITLDGDVTIPGLTISTGGTFTASDATAKTLTITKSTSGSSPTLSNSGTWANGSGGSSVIFTGSPSGSDAIHTISGTISFQNITVNKTGIATNVGVSFGAGSSVSGTLEIGEGGYVATAPPASFYGANAILKFNQGTGATYNVNAGDFSWSTTVIPNFITISSGTVNLNAARTATGNLLIDGGALVLNLNTPNLTIQGNWTRSSGSFTAGSGTVTMSGGLTSGTINVTGGATMYNLVINKTNGFIVNLASNTIVANTLTISGGVLSVNPGVSLTTKDIVNNAAEGIILKSPSDNGAPGSLKIDGTLAGSGTLKAERYIPAWTTNVNGWHLISSPVNDPALSSTNLTPGTNDDFYKWDETQNLWLNQKVGVNNIASMTTGTGYLVAYESASPTKYITGTPNNSAVTFTNLTKTTGKGDGWHVVGNPYPCAIKWNPTIGNSYVLTNIGGIAKIMGNSGSYTEVKENDIIPAMQGFVVQAMSASNTFTIPLNARAHSTTTWTKSSENNSILIVANDLETHMMQESSIRIIDQATQAFDYEYDSHFLPFYAPKFYSKIGNEMLSTNSLPSIPVETVIPFGFEKNDATNFSIELKQSIEGLPVYLTDLKTNTDHNLSENPVYTFTSEAGDDPNRFLLHFLNTTGTVKPTAAQIKVYSTPGKINITGVDGKAEILVRNMMGQVVLSNSVKGSTLQSLSTRNLPAGVYVVSVVSGKQIVSEKVVVK